MVGRSVKWRAEKKIEKNESCEGKGDYHYVLTTPTSY